MTASNLNPGILITTSKIGCEPAPDKVQQTMSALSKKSKNNIGGCEGGAKW